MRVTARGAALAAATVAALAVLAVLLLTRGGDAGAPSTDPSAEVTVAGTVEPAWYSGGRVVVDDTGAAYTVDAAAESDLATIPGARVSVVGTPGPSRDGAEDVPGLEVSSIARAADPGAPRGIDVDVPASVSGTVEVTGAPAGAVLNVDGYTAARAGGDGVLSWDTQTVRDGRHHVSVQVSGDGRVTARHLAWVEVGNGGGPPESLPGTPVFTGDFETGDLRQWDVVQAVGRRSARVVDAPRRQGRYAARFEVRQGDDPIDSTGDRSEVSQDTEEDEGQDRWYAFDIMVPPDFPALDTWQVVAQWHSSEDGSPPVGFYVDGDELVLQVNRHAAAGEPLETVFPWRGPLKRGRWREIVMNVRWSGSDEDGLIRLWVDGVPVLPGTRVRTLYPGFPNYSKIGYYRDDEATPVGVVYHDGFRVTQVSP